MSLVNGEIQPAAMTVAANADVTISIVNLGAGSYVYYCDVGGHREAGAHGTLTVE